MDLYAPLTAGNLELANRVVMAPLTRMRSHADGVPSALNAEHYAQRAGLGLIVTEGVFPSFESKAYPGQPGIVTAEHAEAWADVADAVHAAGGTIVMQVMNAGRVSHPEITGTERIVAPSAVAIDGEVRTPLGKRPYPVPHALTTEELDDVRDEFVAAARRAVDAGLDGVEIHGANGYLLHQFLSPSANRREDAVGGSPAARASFVASVVRAVAAEVGPGRVGIRLSPEHNIQDIAETDPDDVLATYRALIDAISPVGIAYVSLLHAEPTGTLVQDLRSRFRGALVVNSGFGTVTTREEAEMLVASGHADAVAVGRLALANPDLVERWRDGHPENEPDTSTFYAEGARGYTDYPRRSA